MDFPVVAIDGPSGAGKGTAARRVAGRLGFHFLDSGAVYRAAALHCLRRGVDFADEERLVSELGKMQLSFEGRGQGVTSEPRVMLGSEDVTRELRSEATADAASRVAVQPAVRQALLQVQRDFCADPGLVADGRDMGTVVFPHALVKIFLTASPQVRAERRQKQLKEQGMEATLAGLVQEIERRDARDSSRQHAPLLAATDAITIDTSVLSIDQVTDKVTELVTKRLAEVSAAC